MTQSIMGSSGLASSLTQLFLNQQQQSAFQKADRDGNGVLNGSELQTFLSLMSQISGESIESQEATAALNTDGSYAISPPPPPPPEGNPFTRTDADGNGTLDATEIQAFLDKIAEMTGKSVKASDFISALDSDQNGVIDKTEFEAGRKKAETLLGLPPIPDGSENADSTSANSAVLSSRSISEVARALLAGYLDSRGESGTPSSQLSLLA